MFMETFVFMSRNCIKTLDPVNNVSSFMFVHAGAARPTSHGDGVLAERRAVQEEDAAALAESASAATVQRGGTAAMLQPGTLRPTIK